MMKNFSSLFCFFLCFCFSISAFAQKPKPIKPVKKKNEIPAPPREITILPEDDFSAEDYKLVQGIRWSFKLEENLDSIKLFPDSGYPNDILMAKDRTVHLVLNGRKCKAELQGKSNISLVLVYEQMASNDGVSSMKLEETTDNLGPQFSFNSTANLPICVQKLVTFLSADNLRIEYHFQEKEVSPNDFLIIKKEKSGIIPSL